MKYRIAAGTDAWKSEVATFGTERVYFKTTKTVTFTSDDRITKAEEWANDQQQTYVFRLPPKAYPWQYLMVRWRDVEVKQPIKTTPGCTCGADSYLDCTCSVGSWVNDA